MKQGKTLQELGRELQRQRNNRQDFLADTRSLVLQSNYHNSNLLVSIDNKKLRYFTESNFYGVSSHNLILAFRFLPHDVTLGFNKN